MRVKNSGSPSIASSARNDALRAAVFVAVSVAMVRTISCTITVKKFGNVVRTRAFYVH